MKAYKQLAGQTAVYGLSSILGRFLNYLLVPLYTRVFELGEYGIVTQLYAFIAFFTVLFTYGLETAFFRYSLAEKNRKIYSTALISIVVSSIVFGIAIVLFANPIAEIVFTKDIVERFNQSGEFAYYIQLFAGILVFDAISAIPFAMLRQENRAKRFAFIRLVNISINIGLNLFFLLACPALIKTGSFDFLNSIYDPSMGVGYVFLSNLIASVITTLMLAKEIFNIKWEFDSALWKSMIIYAMPLMVAGFAGIINETLDRLLIPYLISDKVIALEQAGIYGACYKLSIIMTLFIQMFRYAAEPFFFNHSTKENPQLVYANVMKVFVIVCSFIFLFVMFYIDVFKYFIGPDFRSGLKIVPILLMANLCLGVFYNLSIWYKLTSKTKWGAWLSIFGAVVTLIFNFWLIPIMGYMGAAWTTLICYAAMMILSYVIGQKYYPVNYDIKSFFFYIILALMIWIIGNFISAQWVLTSKATMGVNTLLLLVFMMVTWVSERRKFSYLRR